jgi:outer membrane protein OmpA-like peptidoglycan-associated protein
VLKSLAERDQRIQYDPRGRTARIDLPLTFRETSAELSADDKLRLDQIARLLRSGQARELEIVVAAGDAERAKAVADYLDRHGISRDRLAVAQSLTSGAAGQVQLQLQAVPTAVASKAAEKQDRR